VDMGGLRPISFVVHLRGGMKTLAILTVVFAAVAIWVVAG
jgi:hypothetical protein